MQSERPSSGTRESINQRPLNAGTRSLEKGNPAQLEWLHSQDRIFRTASLGPYFFVTAPTVGLDQGCANGRHG